MSKPQYTAMPYSSHYSPRLQTPKLPTINETSPLVLSEHNNNTDCELGRGYTSKKSFFDRSFSYALCLGTVMIIAMVGLAFLAATHESTSPSHNRHNNIHEIHSNNRNPNNNHQQQQQSHQNQNFQHNSDAPALTSTFLSIFK